MNKTTEKCSPVRYARTIKTVSIFLVKSDTVLHRGKVDLSEPTEARFARASSGLWFSKPICLTKSRIKLFPVQILDSLIMMDLLLGKHSTIERTTNDHQSTTHLLTYFKVAIFFVKENKVVVWTKRFPAFFGRPRNSIRNPPRDGGVSN